MLMGKITQDNHQTNRTKHRKTPKAQTKTKTENQATTTGYPSMTVVFPLYGCETGEKRKRNVSKGLNSLRKGKMHLDVSGCSGRPVKCGLTLLVRV